MNPDPGGAGLGGWPALASVSGTVKAWIETRGMGFITPDTGGDDAFVHRSELLDGEALIVGSTVMFEDSWDTMKGKRIAKRVSGAVPGSGGAGAGGKGSAAADPVAAHAPAARAMSCDAAPPSWSTGVVKAWIDERGMGFIAPDSGGDDCFVHRSALRDGQWLVAGARVSFEDSWDALKAKRIATSVMGALPVQGVAPPAPPAGPAPGIATLVPSGGGAGQRGSGYMQSGVVKAWLDDRGMGFIQPDAGGDDVFIHRSALFDSEWLVVGHAVKFDDGWDPVKGKRMASWCSVAAAVPGMADGASAGAASSAGKGGWAPAAPVGGCPPPPPPPPLQLGGTRGGVVKAWIEAKGMGFIGPDAGGEDVFVHRTDLVDAQWLVVGGRVNFEEGWDAAKGKKIAKRVLSAVPAAIMDAGAISGTGSMQSGVVKMWMPERGFGFIIPDDGGGDVMVHVNILSEGVTLGQGVPVKFTSSQDPLTGKLKATSCISSVDMSGCGTKGKAQDRGLQMLDYVAYEPPAAGATAPSDNLFVAGLPVGLTEDQLRETFGQYGFVTSCRVLASAGRTDCAAMVQMADVGMATWLVDNLNGNIPAGLAGPVVVRYASKGAGAQGKAGKGGGDAQSRYSPYDGKGAATALATPGAAWGGEGAWRGEGSWGGDSAWGGEGAWGSDSGSVAAMNAAATAAATAAAPALALPALACGGEGVDMIMGCGAFTAPMLSDVPGLGGGCAPL